jgi:hypothetical protein
MQILIGGSDVTSNILRNSERIEDSLREAPNKLTFVYAGSKPSEYLEVKAYESFEILAVDGTTITLDYSEELNDVTGIFRIGDTLVIDIGEADEIEKTITAISAANGPIKLTVTPAASDGTVGEKAGIKMFAGNVIDVNDANKGTLFNIEYRITCLDYTRVFDKGTITDSFEDKDARYIINQFCNVDINKNEEVDAMNYADNTAIQAEWIEGGDGNNPTVDTSDYREGAASGILSWTNSGGTATFTASPPTILASEYTGVASGTPTRGLLGFWFKASNLANITSFVVRIGSSASDYAAITVTPTTTDWVFVEGILEDAAITGTPDWTSVDYLAVVVAETGSANLRVDGFRFLEKEYFRHYPYIEQSIEFEKFRIPRVKPIETMQRIAEALQWYWYIDYDRYIHLFPESTNFSPFNLDENSDNFGDLAIDYDVSRLWNRVVVEGGNETSDSFYTQVVEGDGVVNEWILKNKFKNLDVSFDDNSLNAAAEAGTTTTNITITGHGLVTDDYIVNRTRNNAVRKIIRVDDDNFTVETVASQTDTDTISFFVAKTVGVEGLSVEVGNDYMSNFNEKSIRGAEGSLPIAAGEFLLFKYNEVTPILIKRTENVSVANMTGVLGYSNGVFEAEPIVDKSIQSRSEAILVAAGFLAKYSNMIITAKFRTSVAGLKSGQIITIKDTANGTRNINQDFIIQKVTIDQMEEGECVYRITCSTLLYGFLELIQQLLRQTKKIEINEEAAVQNVEGADEDIFISDVVVSTVGGEIVGDTIFASDSIVESVFEPPFKYGPDPNQAIYNLSSYG